MERNPVPQPSARREQDQLRTIGRTAANHLLTVLILYFGSPVIRMVGVALLFLGLMLDTVDGIVARRTGQASLFGSVLDIAADRTYELVLWVCFADLEMIPVAIPLIIIARTTLSDAFRSIGVGQGTAPFEQHRTPLSPPPCHGC